MITILVKSDCGITQEVIPDLDRYVVVLGAQGGEIVHHLVLQDIRCIEVFLQKRLFELQTLLEMSASYLFGEARHG